MNDRDAAKLLEELRAMKAQLKENTATLRALLRHAQKTTPRAAADEPATCPEHGTAFRTSCGKCVEAVESEGGARDQARARWESAGDADDAMANAERMRGFWIDAADEPGETP